ncbi:valine--tRNA ligase [Striga asiatica]|uniref:Valine--tRNA ligase n=1 Tax=Striga asiatica TaxID=4170 RepID=A0A5A7QDJ4_STRAF|nr:valine--tRNA ligase [Striga asiatica]
MKKVCGFTFSGTRSKAIDFDAKTSWAELSPHTTWDSAGMSNGFMSSEQPAYSSRRSSPSLPHKTSLLSFINILLTHRVGSICYCKNVLNLHITICFLSLIPYLLTRNLRYN